MLTEMAQLAVPFCLAFSNANNVIFELSHAAYFSHINMCSLAELSINSLDLCESHGHNSAVF